MVKRKITKPEHPFAKVYPNPQQPPEGMTPHKLLFVGTDGVVYQNDHGILALDEYKKAYAAWEEQATGEDARGLFSYYKPQISSWRLSDSRRPMCSSCSHYALAEPGTRKKARCSLGDFSVDENGSCKKHAPKGGATSTPSIDSVPST